MKHFLLIFISASVVIGCTCQNKSTKKQPVTDTLLFDSVSTQMPDTTSKLETANDFKYQIVPIDQVEYKNIAVIPVPEKDRIPKIECADNSEECKDKVEQKKMKPYAGSVIRDADTLKLKCGAKGNFLSIVNDKSEAEQYCDYRFEHRYADPQFYLVSASYFEGKKYLLIHPKTCERIEVEGVPLISPDRKRAVAADPDMIPGFGLNKIDFLSFGNGKIHKYISVPLKEWGISEIRWVTDTELHIKKTKLTGEPKQVIPDGYARIVIK